MMAFFFGNSFSNLKPGEGLKPVVLAKKEVFGGLLLVVGSAWCVRGTMVQWMAVHVHDVYTPYYHIPQHTRN
jgi:hypothetical protein